MKRWFKWILIAVVLGLLAAGALRALSARKAQKDALAAQQQGQQTLTAVELQPSDQVAVHLVDLPQTLQVAGPIKAVNSAIVKARVAGELQGLVVREGDVVKAGDVIARVDPTEYEARLNQARQQAESAKAQVDIAQRSFDNNRSLVDQGFISKTALDASQATLAAAQATYRAAQAGADVAAKALDDAVMRAPIAGLVAQRLTQPGERVAVDGRVVEIVDLSRLELEASFNAADSLQVRTGQTAQLTVEGASKPLTAKVVRINPSAVAGSRAVLAYLALEPSPGLRQGLFAQGTLETGHTQTLALPLTSVRTDKPAPYVQVVDKGQIQHQTVTLGARGDQDGQTLVAVQGVAEGAMVLVGSTGTLRAGTPVKIASRAP
jgi:RND family efflux transporter MFP subunit